jgi:hypothetical protein
MADDKNNTGLPANDLISLASNQLRAAVWKVGNSARQVKEYIAATKRRG